ncbi:MAG: hypothetical protein IPP77_05765 [Bacteroidetes bacterium]|nr:hypothetical protein [Bacteroidota bacterium]
MIKISILVCFLLVCSGLSAQNQTDSLSKDVADLKKKVTALDILNKFNLWGYVQMQYQHADTAGAKTYSGGDFPVASSDRFRIRRGRVKLEFNHADKKGQSLLYTAVQVNFSEAGFNLVEYFGRVYDPFIHWFSLTGGMMNRPFGYEIIYSSRIRETPDRARMSQTLFPQERDLGFMATIEPPKTSKWGFFKINAGLYNGTGLGFNEIDKGKDFIGQVVLNKLFLNDHLKLSGGASYYNGRVLQSTPVYYSLENTAGSGNPPRYTAHEDSTGVGKRFFKRKYVGFDLQVSGIYKWGSTTLRGEYIFGKQPGTAFGSGTPTVLGNDIYNRKFRGAYAYFVQAIHDARHSMWHELVVKYDFFDPNTQLAGQKLNSISDSKVSAADVKYHTVGLGYVFRPLDFFKLMVYYDWVINESTGITDISRNLKDNILTVRTQFELDAKWFRKK